MDGTLCTKWEVCERDGVKTPMTFSITLWKWKLRLCQSFNYLEWGLNVQNMLKLLDLYIIENTQMKIRRELACSVRKNVILIVMILWKGNDQKMSKRISTFKMGFGITNHV